MSPRNYRRQLMTGLRDRIERTKSPSKLMFLWVCLMNAGDLPA